MDGHAPGVVPWEPKQLLLVCPEEKQLSPWGVCCQEEQPVWQCELSQVSSCVTAVLADGYSCAQDLMSPAVCGCLHSIHPSEEEQAVGLCRAGFQAAAQGVGTHP